MNVSLNYGHNSITLNIPDKNYLGTLNPKEVKEVENPVNEVKRALTNPIGSKKMKIRLDKVKLIWKCSYDYLLRYHS